VVHVSALFPWWGTSHPPNLAVNRDYINQGITGTQLNYPKFRRGPPLDDTSEDVTIELDHCLGVLSTYDYVI
jgi:hypothetical protein